MEIKQAEFVTSAVEPNQYPDEDIPCIALAGKSNVGKSSLINCLANNYKLARISSQPGKTRLVNFYKMNHSFFIVDLPGYGFARVSEVEKKRWSSMVNAFFTNCRRLLQLILIVDIRHKPTLEDRQMMDWIKYHGFPVIIVASKADKIGKTRWRARVAEITRHLDIPPHMPVIPFSSLDRTGRDELLTLIESSIQLALPQD